MFNILKYKKGFTLIELLVVISIISLLSSVIMASLNTSRARAQEATIKQTLQNLKTQAELEYSKTGDYSTIVPAVSPMLLNLSKNGVTSTTTFSNIVPINEGFKRYGATVRSTSDNKHWSVSSEGSVVTWDTSDTRADGTLTSGYEQMDWNTAQNACKIAGKRLPTIEELKSLRNLYTSAPAGFLGGINYWSDTVSAIDSNAAWTILMNSGSVFSRTKSSTMYLTRCVK